MRKGIGIYLLAIAVSAVLFCGNVSAQAMKIGYVEIRKVFSGYEKAKKAEADFKNEIEAEQKKISQLQDNIKKMQAEFEQKKDILKPEEKAKKEEELKAKVQEYFTLANTTNKNLDAKRQELEEKLLEEIKEEITKYGEKKGFTVILDSRMVLFGQTTIDLTGEIINILNKK